MELRQLRYLVAIADAGSFTAAARSLGVAQPALSQQIRRLEDEVGVRLLDRAGFRTPVVTEAGAALLARARRALAEVDAAGAELEQLRGVERGHVILGAMHALGPLDLPALLAGFHRERPGVSVALREETTERMFELLAGDQLDLALAAIDGGVPDALDAVPLAVEPVRLALPPTHALANGATVRLERLAAVPLVALKGGTGLRLLTDRALASVAVAPPIPFETRDTARARALVAAGLGASLLPASTLAAEGPAVAVAATDPPLERAIGVVRRRSRALAPAARALLDHVVAAARAPHRPA